MSMTEYERVLRLQHPGRKVRMVLDTDTFNEVDDQFAVAYAVRAAEAGELDLEAIYAAPFTHADTQPSAAQGMELSYQEILRVLDKLGRKQTEGFAFRGSDRYMGDTPVDSPAARDLIRRAMASPKDDPLYVVAIGCPTNVSSALRMEPAIAEHIVVIWLGGTPHYWPYASEYNLMQDIPASQTLLDSGVPLIQFPTQNVISHMITTIPELEAHLEGKSAIGTYLTGIVREYSHGVKVWSKVIWDPSCIAWLLHPEAFTSSLQHTPRLSDDERWCEDWTRPLMLSIESVSRDRVFADIFEKLGK